MYVGMTLTGLLQITKLVHPCTVTAALRQSYDTAQIYQMLVIYAMHENNYEVFFTPLGNM